MNEHVEARDECFKRARVETGAASVIVILFKGLAGALPFSKPKSLAIIGESSSPVALA